MSIPVPLAQLSETMTRYPLAYLLTVNDGERVHAVQASPAVDGDKVRVPRLGRRSLANLAERASATLLWPPAEPGGYTLIVDGEAEVTDDGALVSPTRAVLHRAAAAPTIATDAEVCVSDCVEVPLSPG